MESESDVLSHFGVLDELIQVVYQGASRFAVISEVDDMRWMVHVGLSEDNARWWRGQWSVQDIRKVAVRDSDVLNGDCIDIRAVAQHALAGLTFVGESPRSVREPTWGCICPR